MERTVPFLNVCISFVAFITALSLVVYMLVSFVMGTYDVALQILDTIFLAPSERQAIVNVLSTEFLHTIALLIILMKAYRILVEYMHYYHIDIKYMMEIGIIASVLELLFNYQSYTPDMRYIFLGLSVAFAFIYAFRHEVLLNATKASRHEMEARRRSVPAEADMQDVQPDLTPIEEEIVKPKPRKATPKPKKAVRSKKIA